MASCTMLCCCLLAVLCTMPYAVSATHRTDYDTVIDGLKAQKRYINDVLRCKTNEMDFEGFDAKTLFRQSVVAALQAIDQASNIEEPSPSAAATGSDHSEIEAAISSIKTAIAEDACDWLKSSMHLGEDFNCTTDDVTFFKTLLEVHDFLDGEIYRPLRDNCTEKQNENIIESSCNFRIEEEMNWKIEHGIESTNHSC